MKAKIFRCENCNIEIMMLAEETKARCPKCKKITRKVIKIEDGKAYLDSRKIGGVANCKVKNTEGYL